MPLQDQVGCPAQLAVLWGSLRSWGAPSVYTHRVLGTLLQMQLGCVGYVHAMGQVGVPRVAIEKIRVPSTAMGCFGGSFWSCGSGWGGPDLCTPWGGSGCLVQLWGSLGTRQCWDVGLC